MPYKTEKIYIDCPFMDKRNKLLPCQKEMVIHYSQLGYSQRKLAAMFNVSRRLIQFIVNPDSFKKNLQARQDRGGSKIYYDKDKHNESMKKHRKYKHEILKDII